MKKYISEMSVDAKVVEVPQFIFYSSEIPEDLQKKIQDHYLFDSSGNRRTRITNLTSSELFGHNINVISNNSFMRTKTLVVVKPDYLEYHKEAILPKKAYVINDFSQI